ncbi:unnamed protein product, partial [Hymenolepis diminuta]
VFKIQSILLKPSNNRLDDIEDVPSEIIKTSREAYLYLQTPTRAIPVSGLTQDASISAAADSRSPLYYLLISTVMCIVLYR